MSSVTHVIVAFLLIRSGHDPLGLEPTSNYSIKKHDQASPATGTVSHFLRDLDIVLAVVYIITRVFVFSLVDTLKAFLSSVSCNILINSGYWSEGLCDIDKKISLL